jgi:hypothetical protein
MARSFRTQSYEGNEKPRRSGVQAAEQASGEAG